MDKKVQHLVDKAGKMFGGRGTLMSHWQEVAEQLYPERADFTTQRNMGDDFANHLTTSYPVIARRDLGNAISAMLRPRNQNWFSMGVLNRSTLSLEAKQWLERSTLIQRRVLYDPTTKFVRSTKEADHDFTTFGQAVVSVDMNRAANVPLYRCWHLRDVAWQEGFDLEINEVVRKSKVTIATLNQEFKGKISSQLQRRLEKAPHDKVEYYHYVLPTERYQSEEKFSTPYVSVYFEKDTGHVLREEGSQTIIYVVPRWQTVSGSQYAYSPATVAALPDSRLIQSMTLSLLEAGEMATQPPMFARQEIFRGDVQRFASGITYVDIQPEQSIRDVIEFQQIDPRGLNAGINMREEIKMMIDKAFFLDRLQLPPSGPEMTAFEVSQRVTEYIRNALPLFEPLEQNYNAPLMNQTFELLMANGAFGPISEIPEELRGRDIEFQFESPIHEAVEKQKAQIFTQGIGLASQVEAIEPGAMQVIKTREALESSLEGMGFPAQWRRSREEVEQLEAIAAEQQQMQQMLQAVQQGGEAASAVGAGAEALSQAGVL